MRRIWRYVQFWGVLLFTGGVLYLVLRSLQNMAHKA